MNVNFLSFFFLFKWEGVCYIYTLPGKFIFILYTQDGVNNDGLDQNLNHPLPPFESRHML